MMRAHNGGSVRKEWLWFAAAVTTVYCVWGALVHYGQFQRHADLLTAGAAVDLLGVVTLAYWLLVVRRGAASARTIGTVFALSLIGARLLLPASAVSGLRLVRFAFVPLEIGAVAWLVLRHRRTGSSGSGDLAERINAGCAALLPSALAARIVASELSTIAYAFMPASSLCDEKRAGARSTTTFRVAPLLGTPMIWTLVGVVFIEMVPVHLLVQRLSAGAAWTVTGLSLYSALWILGYFRSATMRTCELLGDALVVRVGLRCEAVLPLSAIQNVEPLGWREAAALPKSAMNASRPQSPNVLVTLSRPIRVTGAMVQGRTIWQLAVRFTEPESLIATVSARLTRRA